MGVKQFIVTWVFRFAILVIGIVVTLGMLWRWFKKGTSVLFYVKPRPVQPEILADSRWGEHNYITLKKQGIKLHYVENGSRNNQLMLCLHGFPECWFSWRHQLEEFSSKYWVVAVDMRGYGDSDKPKKVSDYHLDTLVEDIHQLVIELGKDKCTLMAHDWGGLLAWRVVSQHPEIFHRHISLNGPHPTAFMDCLKSNISQLKKSWYIAFFQIWWLPELILRLEDFKAFDKMYRGPNNRIDAFPDDVLEGFKYYYARKGSLTPPINYYRNIDFFKDDPEVSVVTVPTLIIWGTEDMALDKEMAKGATKYCEDVQLKFIEGASHWVQQDEPYAVNKCIWEYLDITT